MPQHGDGQRVLTEDRSVLTRHAPPPDATIRYGARDEQVMDVRFGGAASRERPLVVLLHGGFWRPEYDRMHVRPAAAALSSAGWTTVAPEYRRMPGQPDLTLEDVRAALDLLPRHPDLADCHDGRMLLVGHSAGGHLALLSAAVHVEGTRCAGVLALAPVADLSLGDNLGLDTDAVSAFLGVSADARPDLDPVRLAAPSAPVLILHGTGDGVVPLELSESYVRWHSRALLRPVPAGHFALIDPLSDAWPVVMSAVAQFSVPA
jgi:acetyl esterase/lipase